MNRITSKLGLAMLALSLLLLAGDVTAVTLMLQTDTARVELLDNLEHRKYQGTSDPNFKDTRDEPLAAADGWGTTGLTLSRIGGSRFQGDYLRMPRLRPTRVAAGNFHHDRDSSSLSTRVGDDLVVLTSYRGCHLHFLKNLGVDSDGVHRGWDAGTTTSSTPTWNDYVVSGDSWTDCRADPDADPTVDEPSVEDVSVGDTNVKAWAVALFSGDFTGDGYLDVLYLKASDRNRAGSLTNAYLFVNKGTTNLQGVPRFVRKQLADGSTLFRAGINWHWSSDIGHVINNGPNQPDDLVLASSVGDEVKVVRFRSSGTNTNPESPPSDPFVSQVDELVRINLSLNASPMASVADANHQARTGTGCGKAVSDRSRGITAIALGDFTGDKNPSSGQPDNKLDIVLGSMSEERLFFYENVGDTDNNSIDNYELRASGEGQPVDFSRGGVISLDSGDWKLDADERLDLLVSRTGRACISSPGDDEGDFWSMTNNDGRLEVSELRSALIDDAAHYATALDLDHDAESTLDFIVGHNAAWGSYYFYFLNKRLDLYKLESIATSGNLIDLDADKWAIVAVRLADVDVSPLPTGATLDFEVSNNGTTWETLKTIASPADFVSDDEHAFTNYGSRLMWRVFMKTLPTTLTREERELAGADPSRVSRTSPQLNRVELFWVAVEKQRYSRSGLAQGVVDFGGEERYLVFSSAFDYPSFRGYLRAYDMGKVVGGEIQNLSQETETGINPGENPLLNLRWEAGSKSAFMPGSTRVLYSAYDLENADGNTDGPMDDRFELNQSWDGRAELLGFDSNTEADEFLTFFRDGMDDEQRKLRDVGHSSPVFVGRMDAAEEPYASRLSYPGYADSDSGDPTYLKYSAFISDRGDRASTVLVGANDGGLHAYDAQTGDERWLMVPRNLLSKLKTQWVEEDGTDVYEHNFFVDGSVQIQDIFDTRSGSNPEPWRTIAVVGQAKGTSATGDNYYSAYDVTDPESPKPMWEFSDDLEWEKCSGQAVPDVCNCDYGQTNPATGCSDPSDCTTEPPGEHIFAQQDSVLDLGNAVVLAAANPASSGPSPWTIVSGAPGYIKTPPPEEPINPDECGKSVGVSTAMSNDCPHTSYTFRIDRAGTYEMHFKVKAPPGTTDLFWVSLNYNYPIPVTIKWTGSGDEWKVSTGNFRLLMGATTYTIQLWALSNDTQIEWLVINDNRAKPVATTSLSAECVEVCDAPECTVPTPCPSQVRSQADVDECRAGLPGSLSNEEIEKKCGVVDSWKECDRTEFDNNDVESKTFGECCLQPGTGALEQGHICIPVGTGCPPSPIPDTAMGETWSKPVIGRVKLTDGPKWVVFFGSGPVDTVNSVNAGRSVYALDAWTGEKLHQWDLNEEPPESIAEFSSQVPKIDIPNVLMGGPSLVDIDDDGYVDRLYIGDLEGRLWKIVMDGAGNRGGVISSWQHCVLFDAGDHDADGQRNWAPIVTTPAVAVLDAEPTKGPSKAPNVYFGTGAHDQAPDDVMYKFYAVRDYEEPGECASKFDLTRARHDSDLVHENKEWILGDGKDNTRDMDPLIGEDLKIEGGCGLRYWADPVIVQNCYVYFVSLYGDIESVDPRENTRTPLDDQALLSGASCPIVNERSLLFGIAIKDCTLEGKGLVRQGSSIYGSRDWYAMKAKIRNTPLVANLASQPWTRPGAPLTETTKETRVFAQRFSDAEEKGPVIVAPGVSPTPTMCILRWREIPLP